MKSSTKDKVLDDTCIEYKRLGNIDVFNNAIMCYYFSDIWNKAGRPKETTNDIYAKSPWVAVMKKMHKSLNTSHHERRKLSHQHPRNL